MAVRIQFRRGTAADWTAADPVLSAGEFGFETDTNKFKLGDGTTLWSGLPYPATGTITGVTAGTGLTGGGNSGTVTLTVDSTIYISPQIVDAKGDLVIGTAADTPGRLAVGTNGQVLSANSATTSGLEWVTLDDTTKIAKSLVDAKGDLIVGTANDTVARLAVGTNNFVLTADSAATGGVAWKNPNKLSLNAQTGTTYTLVAGDLNALVTLSNASAITLTVPLNVFTVGDQINLMQLGLGQVTVSGAVGVTVNGTPGTKLRARYSGATLICVGTNDFVVVGDIAS